MQPVELEGARPHRPPLSTRGLAEVGGSPSDGRSRRGRRGRSRRSSRRDPGLGDEGLGQGGQPVRVSGSARLARTSGLTAICSARPATRRPSTRSKVAADCARETAATATRTTTMIASWRAKSCPASVGRRLLRMTTMNSTFSADRSATVARRSRSTIMTFALHTKWISTMRLHRIALGAVVAATLALTGCGATKDQGAGDSSATSGGSAPRPPACSTWSRTLPAAGTTPPPAGAGHGEGGHHRHGAGLQPPGAGGTVGLQRVVNEKGNGKLAMQMGLGVVGAAYTQNTKASLNDTTPSPSSSRRPARSSCQGLPYTDINQLVDAWKDPKSRGRWRLLARWPRPPAAHAARPAVGIDPKTVSFVSYDGGGELLRRCSATRSPSAPAASASSSTRSRPGTSASSR